MTKGMGIIKVEIRIPELVRALESFRDNRVKALEALTSEIKTSVGEFFNSLLNAEMEIFLGQSDQESNSRNGYRDKKYALKGIGSIEIRMPTDRKRKFKSDVLPKYEQIDPRLKEDIAVLHLAGLSNRVLAMVAKRILGCEVSTATISRSLDVIEPKALEWLERPLTKKYWALFIDGTNFRIQRRGTTEKEPTLVVLGIDEENHMSILYMQPGNRDHVSSWREVFKDLIKRGLDPMAVRIGVMDGLPGLETAFKEGFHRAVTGRCWVHAITNALAKVPERLKEPFKESAHRVMYAASEADARAAFIDLKAAMASDAQSAVRVLEKDLDSLLVHYKFDRKFWPTLRTTNPVERINKELKRRTKSMETLGERTLHVLLAFTAMRLEYHWSRVSVDTSRVKKIGRPKNRIEAAAEQLIH